jgi:glucose/arabinose dehydrogenase
MSKRAILPLALSTLVAVACSKENPPTVLDSSVDVAIPTDNPVAPDRVVVVTDAGVDAPDVVTPRPDVPPADVQPGMAFCDLPGEPVPAGVTVPEGFCIKRFARVQTPRVLTFAPNGDLFVASPSTSTPGGNPIGRGAIMRFTDVNRDGVADSIEPGATNYLTGVPSVHGLLFVDNELMYTVENGVYAIPYQSGDAAARAPVNTHRQVADLRDFTRWTHGLARGVDGSIYVSMGQYDIAQCPVSNARSGSILRIGAGMPMTGQLWVSGFRNPMYLRCKEWGACYGAELTGDGWGGIGGREKLIEMRQGDSYGYPCCVDRARPVPGVGTEMGCANVAASVQSYPLHDTPFGFDWAPTSWPGEHSGAFFVGLHGWVGSWTNAGVQWAPTDPTTHRPTRDTVPFVQGFGHRGPVLEGRVADLIFAPDGRMFFSDPQDGGIYWVAPRTLTMPAR